jgi:hypothetical protein
VENFATVVELVQCPNKMAKTGYCTLKPDFQKASLILTARGFPGRFFFFLRAGFPGRQVWWVKQLLETSWAEILIIGQTENKFKIQKWEEC